MREVRKKGSSPGEVFRKTEKKRDKESRKKCEKDKKARGQIEGNCEDPLGGGGTIGNESDGEGGSRKGEPRKKNRWVKAGSDTVGTRGQ